MKVKRILLVCLTCCLLASCAFGEWESNRFDKPTPMDSIVAWYKLDDSGGIVNVENSRGVDGTAVVTVDTLSDIGIINGCFDFNGTSEYVNCNQAFESTFRDSFSVSFWARAVDGRPAASYYFCGTYIGAGAPTSLFSVQLETRGKLYCYYYSNNIAAQGYCQAQSQNAVFSDGDTGWHFIVAVIDNTAREIRLYVDSAQIILDPSGPVSTEGKFPAKLVMADYVNSKELLLSARNANGTPNGFYSGKIDDFMIFRKVLSEHEIRSIYERTYKSTKWWRN